MCSTSAIPKWCLIEISGLNYLSWTFVGNAPTLGAKCRPSYCRGAESVWYHSAGFCLWDLIFRSGHLYFIIALLVGPAKSHFESAEWATRSE